MSKTKIAVIGVKSFPAIGGAAGTIDSLIHHLGDDFNITVYLNRPDGNPEKKKEKYNSVVFNLPSLKRFNTLVYYVLSCFHALLFGRYKIVHVQHLYSGFIVPFLRIRFKVVTTVHGIIPADDNKWNVLDKFLFRIIEKLSLRYSNKIVSVSNPQIAYLKILTEKNIQYIPNGVQIIDTIPLGAWDNLSQPLTFSAARIIKIKGCDLFLKALKEIQFMGPIKIIGDLTHIPAYKKEIENLCDGLDVSFKGLITQKEILYKELVNSRFFIFPSTKEGLSNMLLEVASLKIPIICSDIVENKAIFDENEILYFQNGNIIDLAQKISYALHHNSDMEARAHLAFKRVESYYPWEMVAQKYIDLFSSIIENKPVYGER
jgi:glycosyltransferase involved in cell wall biosynthesis